MGERHGPGRARVGSAADQRTMAQHLEREVLRGFWKVHILHHASMRPVYGLWLLAELAEHGYRVSPGTLYPILKRMEMTGWLRAHRNGSSKGRCNFEITAKGRRALDRVRGLVTELYREVAPAGGRRAGKRPRRSVLA
ncbi:MAG: PadR family transcriptional regulator [Planctomycetota bacterium]